MLDLILRHFAQDQAQVDCAAAVSCDTGLPKVQATQDQLAIALEITFGIIGALAVIMIIVAALRMISAQGDPQTVARTRQTIIFAAVGLAVAVSAEAIVTFTIGKL